MYDFHCLIFSKLLSITSVSFRGLQTILSVCRHTIAHYKKLEYIHDNNLRNTYKLTCENHKVMRGGNVKLEVSDVMP